eukprot:3657161-Prymnesium_polylepis.1
MVQHVGDSLLSVSAPLLRSTQPQTNTRDIADSAILMASQYDELVATNRAGLLSPLELSCRVVVKGKVKQREKSLSAESFKRFTIRATRATARRTLLATGFRLRLTSTKPDAAASNRSRASSITGPTELSENGFSDVQAKVGVGVGVGVGVCVCACVLCVRAGTRTLCSLLCHEIVSHDGPSLSAQMSARK